MQISRNTQPTTKECHLRASVLNVFLIRKKETREYYVGYHLAKLIFYLIEFEISETGPYQDTSEQEYTSHHK